MWRYRNAAHYLAGALTALSALVSWVLPLVGAGVFLVYELQEDKILHDEAYPDILEFAIGYFTTCAILIGRAIWAGKILTTG